MIKLFKFFTVFILLANSLCSQVIFSSPPPNFSPKNEVSICFIKSGDRFLFLKRQYNKPEGNTWGVPGGKLDPKETAQKAVVREISEETGIALDPTKLHYCGKVYAKGASNDVILHIFEITVSQNPPPVTVNPVEHQTYQWITLQDSLKLPLISGEEECIDYVYG